MIKLVNFWETDNVIIEYFEKLTNENLYVFSIFGDIKEIDNYKNEKKILLIGENTNHKEHMYLKNKEILNKFNLVLGFDKDNINYIRCPIWMFHNNYFLKDDTYMNFICEHQTVTNYQIFDKKMCCLIARSDRGMLRRKILRTFKFKIDCPSNIGKNMETIESKNMTKIDFLKDYLFNICPENSYAEGYTTEKLFECAFGNCIPIYFGSLGEEEKLIFNENRIIFINCKNLKETYTIINELYENKNKLYEFYNQPIFKKGTENVIKNMFDKLGYEIRQLYNTLND